MASQPCILCSMTKVSVSIPQGQEIEEEETTPLCFSLQPLSVPGVMYFTSLVRTPRVENPSMSVRRPGTILGDERDKHNVTISAGEAKGYSPVPLP